MSGSIKISKRYKLGLATIAFLLGAVISLRAQAQAISDEQFYLHQGTTEEATKLLRDAEYRAAQYETALTDAHSKLRNAFEKHGANAPKGSNVARLDEAIKEFERSTERAKMNADFEIKPIANGKSMLTFSRDASSGTSLREYIIVDDATPLKARTDKLAAKIDDVSKFRDRISDVAMAKFGEAKRASTSKLTKSFAESRANDVSSKPVATAASGTPPTAKPVAATPADDIAAIKARSAHRLNDELTRREILSGRGPTSSVATKYSVLGRVAKRIPVLGVPLVFLGVASQAVGSSSSGQLANPVEAK